MISIVICCYNSSQRLPKTLSHLAQLKNSFGIDLELLIIDNNSSDATGAVAQKEWKQLNEPYPLVVHEEKEPGISAARRKGVLCSNYPYILFCDDDNWLAQDYVVRAVEIIKKYPQVGIIGGYGIPELESEAPQWFQKYKHSYAVGKQAKESGFLKKWQVVYGAGMIINKSILLKMYQAGFQSLLSGRKGKALSSGEDNEICLWYNFLGATIYYDDQMKFQHLIPADRLTEAYYQKRAEEKGKVEALFRIYKNALQSKKNSFLHNTLIWYYEILKRTLLLLKLQVMGNGFDQQIQVLILKKSINFRMNNRTNLFHQEQSILDMKNKLGKISIEQGE